MPHHKQMSSRRFPGEVHYIWWPARLLVFANNPHCFISNRLLSLIGRGADVMGADNSVEFEDWIFHCPGSASGLARKNVEPGANAPFTHCAFKRGLLDDLCPRGVYEIRTGLQGIEDFLVDQISCLVFE